MVLDARSNSEQAIHWFLRAAERSFQSAICNLCNLYCREKQFLFARVWHNRLTQTDAILVAADQIIHHHYFCDAKELLEKIRTLVIDEAMLPQFNYLLGRVLTFQSTCECCLKSAPPIDLTEALTLFRFSAERGHCGAQIELGHLLNLRGYRDVSSQEESLMWYSLAAEQGDDFCQRLVCCHYQQKAHKMRQDGFQPARSRSTLLLAENSC